MGYSCNRSVADYFSPGEIGCSKDLIAGLYTLQGTVSIILTGSVGSSSRHRS
jgi:hypothetical protein